MTDASENQASGADDKVAVVIVAAGRGARAGQANGPKQYQRIGGRAVIARTLETFLSHPRTGPVVVAIHADDGELFRKVAGADADRVITVTGGDSRQASVRLGLLALRDAAPGRVLVHDAVRPFVDAGLIDRTIDAVGERQGALPALPVADTLKRESAAGMIEETVSRNGLHAAQTPQGFPFWPLLAAHEKAHHLGKADFTDDAAIAEWAHIPVKIVQGSPDNIKLTWARDI
ncbi:2-C-methyl-D-erythritol 4-phosphate cytidylyltransferase, partial [Mesorhizobium sp. M4A.F.Ca.ET.050.02.1.1]